MDTLNKYGVGLLGRSVVVMHPPRQLTPDEAVMFAAWLVALARVQVATISIEQALEAVNNT